jgi:hypothetical protein
MLVRRNPNNQAIAIGEFVNHRFTNSPLPLALPPSSPVSPDLPDAAATGR